jgi:hypothetical protein
LLLPDIIDVIETAALATFGTDLFSGGLPPTPSECCALVEYGGMDPLRTQNEGAVPSSAQGAEQPRFQLLVRAADYEAGRNLIQSIWNVLDAIVNRDVNGTFYQRVAALQSPFMLERDANDRWIFIANFQASKGV